MENTMKRKIIFLLIATAILSASASIPAYGQKTNVNELKRRILKQVRTATPQPAVELAMSDTDGESRMAGFYDLPKNSLAGTWEVILTFSDQSKVHSTLQIMPGANPGEGSALHASEFSLAPPNPTVPEQGSWRFVTGNQFVASYYGYSFDENLQPFGKIGFRHVIWMDRHAAHFTGRAIFEVLDNNGNVLFTDQVLTEGTLQRARL